MKNIKIINSKEYTLIKNEKSHKILIKQNENRIIINSREYHLLINNPEEFYKNNRIKFKTLSELYYFIIDLFDRNEAYI
jgi:hypothetical protein